MFDDFAWPADLPPFSRFNLIYGWNGSGKTTLSSLLRHLQNRADVTEGEIEFEIDGRALAGDAIAVSLVPEVRVFDRDFVERTVLASPDTLAPIYFLGKDSVEKQRQLEGLRGTLATATTDLTAARLQREATTRALDRFCIDKASLIRGALTSARFPKYNNYDKRTFRQAVSALTEDTYQNGLLDDRERKELLLQKDAQLLEAVPCLAERALTLHDVKTRGSELLRMKVLSQALDELIADGQLAAWVQHGLELHKGDHHTDICRFCGQQLPPARRQALEAHFNDAFVAFQGMVTGEIANVSSIRLRLAGMTRTDESRLYQHLRPDYSRAVAKAQDIVAERVEFLRAIEAALEKKKGAPFEELDWPTQASVPPDAAALQDAIDALNAVLRKHNETTAEFKNKIESAYLALEAGHVAEAFPEYEQKKAEITKAEGAVASLTAKADGLGREIAAIERDIVEHQRPADELNRELRAYLGHDQLALEVKESGYAITRAGHPATHLSEGEKTAIAFLYFLKSLQDKDFDLATGGVVIDDPVSSLDASALFSAFGYMKERVQGAGQLFVLTHNFAFFRQVKNWFHHLHGQRKRDVNLRPAGFYFLKAYISGEQRSARITVLDPLLAAFESEYHYLFKVVKSEAERADKDVALEEYYGLPNIARRVLEAFLAFRHPDASGDLHQRLDRVDFDPKRKVRVLRLLHTYSHSDSITDPGHDPTLLSETKTILRDVLALIEASDPAHYAAMTALLAKHEAPDHGEAEEAVPLPAAELPPDSELV